MVDAVGISTGAARLKSSAQGDYPNVQNVAIGAGVTHTTAFATLATVVNLRANVNCWFSVGPTAAAHTAGSDYLPANTTWMLKIPQGATFSFIQDSVGGWVSVTPMLNQFANPTPGPSGLLLDSLPAAVGAYSFRKLRTAYAGAAMQVKRGSDNATQDIGFDSSGNFDIAGFNSFIGASTGYLNLWYDQSGNGNTMNAAGVSTAISLTALNGKPGATLTGGVATFQHQTTPVYAQPLTYNCIGYRTGAVATAGMWGDDLQQTGIYPYVTTGTCTIYAGTLSATVPCSNGVMHCLTGVFNGSSSSLTVDGTTTSGLSPGAGGNTGFRLGNVGGNAFTGTVSEALVWNSALSAANITTLGANQKAYWGTP